MRAERLPARWLRLLDALARAKRRPPDLARFIYETHFARWSPTGSDADPSFVESVALATSRAMMWEPGWEVTQRAGPWSFVHSGLMQLFVRANEMRPRNATVGQQVEVRMPCLREGLMPGFLYAFSRAGQIDPAAPHMRVYANVDATRGAWLMERLLTDRATSRLRFEAKIPSTRGGFSRCDTLVIYAAPSNARAVLEYVIEMKHRASRGWRALTPFAAHEVTPGIAVAESPPFAGGAAQSFGEHRSRLVAQSLEEGLAAGEKTPRAWAGRLVSLLRAEGIDPQFPHAQRLPGKFWNRLLR